MRDSKIILIGCSLYSIFLALNLSKKTKKKIIILESSDRFLKSFSPLKIKNIYCNPGFHSFEKDRSKNIVRYMKRFDLNFTIHAQKPVQNYDGTFGLAGR